jgi:hypothetical protein
MKPGLPNREAFLGGLSAIADAAEPGSTVVAYGYHNLVHGDLTRADLDAITSDQPLIVWHYSSHDFYLNSAAIEAAGFTPALAQSFHGIDLDENGELTGRIYEDAALLVIQAFAGVILAPENVTAGFHGFLPCCARRVSRRLPKWPMVCSGGKWRMRIFAPIGAMRRRRGTISIFCRSTAHWSGLW